MKTITCKKCGAIIDASSGECPSCGTVYYILTEDPVDSTPRRGTFDDSDMNIYTPRSVNSPPSPEQHPFTPGLPTANGQRPPIQSQSPVHGQRPPINPQPPIQGQRPPMNPQPPIQGQRPPMNPQPPIQGQRPPMNPQPPIQGQRPPMNPQPPIQGQRPPMNPQPPIQGQRPHSTPNQFYQPPNMDARPRPAQPGNSRMPPPGGGRKPPSSGGGPGKGQYDRRKILLIGGAVGIFAVLTLFICIMAGVFSFGSDAAELPMPDLLGSTKEEAESIINELDLGISIKYKTENSDEPKDTVISQDVKANKLISKNQVITLTLSSGEPDEDEDEDAEPVTVPNLLGLTYDKAKTALEDVGLKISRKPDEFSNLPEGEVVSQNPSYRSEAKQGDIVYVIISKGNDGSPSPSASPSPSPSQSTHTISVTAGKGGSVSPNGQVLVQDSGSKSFTITPDSGYEISDVKVDGSSVGAVSSYSFQNVRGNHTIYAIFRLKVTPTPPPTPTPAPTPTPTPAPTPTPTPTPAPTPTPTPAPTPTPTPSPTPDPDPTEIPEE